MALAAILKAIVKGTPRTAAELRDDLAKIDTAALEKRVEELEAKRRQLLLRGSDAEVSAIGEKITSANLDCERAAIVIEELTRLIGEADQREAAVAIENTVAEADTARERLGETTAELDQAVGNVASLLASMTKQTDKLRGLNKAIEKAGRPTDKVADMAIVRRKVMERVK